MKCIVFDIDGTLFNTQNEIIAALNEVIIKNGGKKILSEDEHKYIGPPIKESLINLQLFNEEKANIVTVEYRSCYIEKYINKSCEYLGTREVLEALKNKGYHLCIATMKTKKQVEKLLERDKYFEFFEMVESAKDDGSYKKCDMLTQIKQSISSNEYYMIGDTMGDYIAAQKAGYEFIAADYGYGDLSRFDGTHIKRIKDLISIL